MNRNDLISKLLETRPGWRADYTASAHVSLETLLETLEHLKLLDVPAALPDLRVCTSCGERLLWPDGFANGGGKGLAYVCKRCAEDAWLQMLPSNRAFSLSCPNPEDVDLKDIAWHLSGICRYHGGTDLSVAEHAVRCSMNAPAGFEIEALHHDDHEAYTGDMPGPMKRFMGLEYKALEERVDKAVRFALKLPWPPSPQVHEVDLRMLATEKAQLFGKEPKSWGIDAAPYDEKIECWGSTEACERFLARHAELTGGVR